MYPALLYNFYFQTVMISYLTQHGTWSHDTELNMLQNIERAQDVMAPGPKGSTYCHWQYIQNQYSFTTTSNNICRMYADIA